MTFLKQLMGGGIKMWHELKYSLKFFLDMDTIAVPCDGKVECQDAADEWWLCTDQNYVLYALLGNIQGVQTPLCHRQREVLGKKYCLMPKGYGIPHGVP